MLKRYDYSTVHGVSGEFQDIKSLIETHGISHMIQCDDIHYTLYNFSLNMMFNVYKRFEGDGVFLNREWREDIASDIFTVLLSNLTTLNKHGYSKFNDMVSMNTSNVYDIDTIVNEFNFDLVTFLRIGKTVARRVVNAKLYPLGSRMLHGVTLKVYSLEQMLEDGEGEEENFFDSVVSLEYERQNAINKREVEYFNESMDIVKSSMNNEDFYTLLSIVSEKLVNVRVKFGGRAASGKVLSTQQRSKLYRLRKKVQGE